MNVLEVKPNTDFTFRASSDELRKWEDEGAEFFEPADFVNARLVATADRARHIGGVTLENSTETSVN